MISEQNVSSKQIKSLLIELDSYFIDKDRELILESRANNLIQSAINLMAFIKENYDKELADELERRFINSIRGQDPSKFTRGIKKIKEGRNNK